MTSPNETVSNRVDEEEPSEKKYTHFEAWGVKIPLPRWAILGIGFLAIIGSGASVYFNTFGARPAQSSTQMSILDPSAAPQAPPCTKLAKADDDQYVEWKKHRGQKPITKTVQLSSEVGAVQIEFFVYDGCLHILRSLPGNPQSFDVWIPNTSFADPAPGKIDKSTLSRVTDQTDGFGLGEAQMLPASFNLAAASMALAPQDTCIRDRPHPGEFQSKNGEQRGCWLQIWRTWEDGCTHYQWYNTCNGYWDSEPNGAPRVYWTSCARH